MIFFLSDWIKCNWAHNSRWCLPFQQSFKVIWRAEHFELLRSGSRPSVPQNNNIGVHLLLVRRQLWEEWALSPSLHFRRKLLWFRLVFPSYGKKNQWRQIQFSLLFTLHNFPPIQFPIHRWDKECMFYSYPFVHCWSRQCVLLIVLLWLDLFKWKHEAYSMKYFIIAILFSLACHHSS